MEKRRKATKHPKKDVLWFIIYKIVMDCTYAFLHKDLYGYYGFGFEVDALKLLVSWTFFLISVVCISSNVVNCRTIFLYTTMCLGMTPVFVYYQFNVEAKTWMVFLQTATLLLMDFIMNKLTVIKPIRNRKIPHTSRNLKWAVTAAIVLFFVMSFAKYGLPDFSQLSFSNIGAVRKNAQVSTLMNIVQNIMCKIVCPLTMMMLFTKKKWFYFIAVLGVQLYVYSVTGFKTFLFVPVVVIGLTLFSKWDFTGLMVRALPFVCVCCTLIYVFFGQIYPYALINERVLFLPAKIKFAYFDYFSQHDFVYFSQSTIGKLLGLRSSYVQNIPNLIGEVYFDKPNMWTNTGFMADAYSNMGAFGMFIIAIFVSLVVSMADGFLADSNKKVSRGIHGVFLLFFISLNDGSAISVFFSGGMIFALIIAGLVSFNDGDEIKACEKRLRYGNVRSRRATDRNSIKVR